MGSNYEKDKMDHYTNINKHLHGFEKDFFYHLNLGKNQDNLTKMFGDVKFVCMGGTGKRMQRFANYMKDTLQFDIPTGLDLNDMSKMADRYSMYKLGPILFANHGMGCPSLSILLHEIMKLLFYARCINVTFFRIGTCGGIGIEPGTVVFTEEAIDGLLRPGYRVYVLGEEIVRDTKCDLKFIEELMSIGSQSQRYKIVKGKTVCANDFYEGQGRLDGYFCDYNQQEKMEFLKRCRDEGVVNFEMESLCFAGMLSHAKIRFAVICVALLDRLKEDQITYPAETLAEFQERPFEIVCEYIKRNL